MAVPGFNITLHSSISQPLLLAGVPRKFAILNGTICAAFALGLHSLYVIPVCLAAHLVGVFLTKRDPYFFSTITRHIRQKPYYRV